MSLTTTLYFKKKLKWEDESYLPFSSVLLPNMLCLSITCLHPYYKMLHLMKTYSWKVMWPISFTCF